MNVQLNYWLSACRALMVMHPVKGAVMFDQFIGRIKHDFIPGWNHIQYGTDKINPDVYTFIDTENISGTTIFSKPDVDENEIHEVNNEYGSFADMTLWYIFQGHTGALIQQCDTAYVAYILLVQQAIEKAVNLEVDRRLHARDSVKIFETETLNGGAFILACKSKENVFQIVRDYLDFKISNTIASQMLAYALIAKRVLGNDIKFVNQDRFIKIINYYSDLTYEIFEYRETCGISNFMQLTYLGCLYADVALQLTYQIDDLFPDVPPDIKRRVGKQAQIVDETIAHYGIPSFFIPAMLAYPEEGPACITRYIGYRPVEQLPLLVASHKLLKELILEWREKKEEKINLTKQYHQIIANEDNSLDILTLYPPYPL